jgi:integrase/recombinase XerD
MPNECRALVEHLRETQRYNPVVVHNYCRHADYFLRYLAKQQITLQAVTPIEVADYLRLSVRQFRKRHGRAPASFGYPFQDRESTRY